LKIEKKTDIRDRKTYILAIFSKMVLVLDFTIEILAQKCLKNIFIIH